MPSSQLVKPCGVSARARQTLNKASRDRIGNNSKNNGDNTGSFVKRPHSCTAWSKNEATNSAAKARVYGRLPSPHQISIFTLWSAYYPNRSNSSTNAPRRVGYSASLSVAERSTPTRRIRSGCCACCHHRPRSRRGTEESEEGATLHSKTSSASASSLSGVANPIALAIFRLITRSNLAACIIGKSAGFSPLRIRPVCLAWYCRRIRHRCLSP